MTAPMPDISDRLNSRLAWLLGHGSWLSSGLIAIGMAQRMFDPGAPSTADRLVSAGILVLIALPVMRVATMSLCFLLRRERDFALIATLVLAIIIASTLLGIGAG
jgi:hypothetical protein